MDEDLSHRQINEELGKNGSYTATVEKFLGSLNPGLHALLGSRH